MKKYYTSPAAEILLFDSEEVEATSASGIAARSYAAKDLNQYILGVSTDEIDGMGADGTTTVNLQKVTSTTN